MPGGKVKNLVNSFSKSSEVQKQPANGAAELKMGKRFKRPPTIKPKPHRTSLPPQIKLEQAPPLPMKRTRALKKQKSSRGEDGDSVEGDRSGEPTTVLQSTVIC